MIHIDTVEVQTLSSDRLYVRWSLKPTAEDVLDYRFSIARSTSSHGPWTVLADDVIDRYELVDWEPDLIKHGWENIYYQVTISNPNTGEEEVSDPTSVSAPYDLVGLEIRRRELLLWKEFSGKKMILFRRKNFGTRCQCWDSTLQKQLISRCPTCFDTTYVGGYMTPMWMWVQMSPSDTTVQYTRESEMSPDMTMVMAPPIPLLSPGDVLVEPDSTNRWRVVGRKQTERFRTPIHQEATLKLIPKGDIEYSIPVVVDTVFDLYFGKRNLSMTLVGAV